MSCWISWHRARGRGPRDRVLMGENQYREPVLVAKFVTDDEEAHSRVVQSLRACLGIPTEALEAGVVEKAFKALEMLAKFAQDASTLDFNEDRTVTWANMISTDALALLRQIKGDQHG